MRRKHKRNCDFELGKDFEKSPQAQAIKQNTDKLDLNKI